VVRGRVELPTFRFSVDVGQHVRHDAHREGQVTSWLGCAQAEVTIERIASLAATTGTEPLTVDFKEKASPRLAECVASMANAHGGLIFVGITDRD
jgi:predicted alpha/beta hydrolase